MARPRPPAAGPVRTTVQQALVPEGAATQATVERIRLPYCLEPEHCHAALLLYAIQEPAQRSFRAASRAVNRTDTALRGWGTRWDWAGRCAREGLGSPATAARLWARDYLPTYGRGPVDLVAGRCSPATIVLATTDPATGLAAPSAEEQAPNAELSEVRTGAKPGEAPQGPRPGLTTPPGGPSEADREREAERLTRARAERERQVAFYGQTQRILEAGVGAVGRQLRSALELQDVEQRDKALWRLGIRFRDLPALLKEHRELGEVLGVTQSGQVGAPALEPSYRVQLAQQTGSDVLTAMLDDVAEVQAVLQQLRDRTLAVPSGSLVGAAEGETRPDGPVLVPDAPTSEPGQAAGVPGAVAGG